MDRKGKFVWSARKSFGEEAVLRLAGEVFPLVKPGHSGKPAINKGQTMCCVSLLDFPECRDTIWFLVSDRTEISVVVS